MILCGNPKAQYLAHKKQIQKAITGVLSKGRYVLGEECESFEKEFSRFTGSKYGAGTANGTDAIFLTLRALGVGPGDEVITVSHTAVATAAAILMSGAKPVFVDIDPVTYTMDASKIKACITRRSKAILPVHLYGQPAELGAIMTVAKKYGLFVVEDCAQAHGARYRGKRVGSIGDAGCFSFYPTKNLGAIGDGGMVTTSIKKMDEKIRNLRQYGWDRTRISQNTGFNSRLDEIQAAILRAKLKSLEADNQKRNDIASRYSVELKKLPLVLPSRVSGTQSVYHQYVIRTKKRDALQKYLAKNGIQTLVHYPVPVHCHPAFKSFKTKSLEHTDQAAREVLSLPIFPEMTQRQCGLVIRTIQTNLLSYNGTSERKK